METLAHIAGTLSLVLNIVFFILLKKTNIMRGPKGEHGFTGPQGMMGKCECKCTKDDR